MSEEYIIGNILNKPKLFNKAYELLRPHHFSNAFCRGVYKSILELKTDDIPIDNITVHKKGHDIVKLNELTSEHLFDTNFDFHIKKIYEDWVKREAERITKLQLEKLKPSDVFDWLGDTQDKLFGITRELDLVTGDIPISQDIDFTIDDAVRRSTGKTEGLLTSTSFPSLNSIMGGGAMLGNLMVISGREKDGKTAFAYRLVLDYALAGNPVSVFNYEVNKLESYWRLFSYLSDAKYENFRSPKDKPIDFYPIRRQLHKKLNEVNLFVYDSSYTDVELINKIKLIKEKYNTKIAVIDYAGLVPITTRYETREKDIANFSRTLKQLAKELEILIIAISQRNRADDIAESLAFQRDCDFALVVKNPALYGDTQYNYRGELVYFDEGDFFIYQSHTRHSTPGGYLKAIYNNGDFVEKTEIL